MNPGSKPIIGQKGVQYGLQIRAKGGAAAAGSKKEQPGGGGKKEAAGKGGPLSMFGGDSDSEEEGVGAQVARQAAKKRSDAKASSRRPGVSLAVVQGVPLTSLSTAHILGQMHLSVTSTTTFYHSSMIVTVNHACACHLLHAGARHICAGTG
jgi:hypothetical protein